MFTFIVYPVCGKYNCVSLLRSTEQSSSCANLQLISVIKVDMNGRHHPGVEEIGQDLPSDGVGDEMEVEWVPSDTEKNKYFLSFTINYFTQK